MSPKSFGILAAGTAIALVLAGWAITTRNVPSATQPLDEPLFASLPDQLDKVATVKVQAGGNTITIHKDGQTGRLVERGGYPADPAKVREVARGLAGLRLVEARTAVPERLPRLELEDPRTKDAKSKEVTLEDADGKPIASAILGKQKYD